MAERNSDILTSRAASSQLNNIIISVSTQPCHCGLCQAWRCSWSRGRGWRGWPWCPTWSRPPEVHHVKKLNSWARKQILFYQNCKIFLCGQWVTCPATLECSAALISKTNPDWMSKKYRKGWIYLPLLNVSSIFYHIFWENAKVWLQKLGFSHEEIKNSQYRMHTKH